jgi:hypothetical protein
MTIVLLLSGAAMAQSPDSPNSLYLELAGNGIFYSANYDRLFTESYGGRVGFGFVTAFGAPLITSFPLMAYRLIGSGNSKLELGLGVCGILQPDDTSFSTGASDDWFEGNGVLGTMTACYRYQRAEGGIVFRVGVTPFFGKFVHITNEGHIDEAKEDVYKFTPFGGISVGYAF